MLHLLKSFLGICQTPQTPSQVEVSELGAEAEPTPPASLTNHKSKPASVSGLPAVSIADRNLVAFLWVIRHCEGTSDVLGYRRLFGGKNFENYSEHPNIKTAFKLGGKVLYSTAAGAYQFLYSTWTSLVRMHGYKDFSPDSQDKGATELIKGRKALQDVYDGNFEEALTKCAKEWASLPGSPYGQPVKTLAFCKKIYEQYGGTYGSNS